MDLKNQVCSLELARRLKELGVKQKSAFYWVNDRRVNEDHWVLVFELWTHPEAPIELLSAYTVAELGEMLPEIIGENGKELQCVKYPEGWIVGYWDYDTGSWAEHLWSKDAPTEADARAKMLIYLIENKLIKVEINSTE